MWHLHEMAKQLLCVILSINKAQSQLFSLPKISRDMNNSKRQIENLNLTFSYILLFHVNEDTSAMLKFRHFK